MSLRQLYNKVIPPPSQEKNMIPKIGEQAPDFCLENHQSRKVCLRYFHRASNVVLAFFPLAWTPI